MSAWFVKSTNEGYVADTRCWYKIFEHMIMNNAFAADMNAKVQDAGIQYNKIFGSARSQKTTRRYMMEEVLGLPYADGYFSRFWADLQKNGYIHARDGYVDSHCKDWLRRTTHFEMALGKNGYWLTVDGVRKFLKAYKTANEDKLKAVERATKLNSKNSNVHNLKEL